ncbi:metal-dependent hydrolase [Flavicella sediminum]|uniref:metal-dependent hydrolase n=1 Tax=Flavicella sediminum TaxID=2585141 RepID=UPI0011208837|nr:metal-dependent hydrolase [Flavicella sediminum]
MKITFLGHACFSIQIGDTTLLIDPFITGNPLAEQIDIQQLKADYILITHAHKDHILDVEAIAKNTGAILISNAEIIKYFGKLGLEGHPMNIGGSWEFDFGKVSYTNAVHSSSFPDGTYGGNPGGFIVEGEHKNIYIAGDTALTYDMKLIPLKAKLDVAILPIGDNFTMNVDDAIIASDFIECDKIIGCHFDTFGYIEIDQKQAIKKFYDKNKDLMLLAIGETVAL